MLKKLFRLFFALIAIPFLTTAQVTTSSMTGIVKDVDGQELAGATISAVHLPTGTKYSTVSRNGGNFQINNMRSGGPYRVTVSYVGHKTETYDDVFLQLAEATSLTASLTKSGAELQNVVITSSGRNNVLNSNRTGAVTNIGTREIQRLPTVSRSLNDFLRITPQSNGAYVGGGNNRQNFVTVDGSDFNNTFGIGNNLPAGGSPISLDAIEEMSVSITPYDIRQSGFIGSAVNAVTKSGNNNFSASVYSFWRSQNQQGGKVGKENVIKQNLKYNQYGARVGGPIINNKLFYFLNFETDQELRPGQSKVAATASNPFGSASNIARPTATELDDISSFLKTKYGYETGPYQGYDFPSNKEKFLARIDWNIASKHRFNVRYSQVESKTPSFTSGSTGSTGIGASGTGSPAAQGTRTDINSLHFSNSNYFQEANFYSLAGELNSSFAHKISNIARVSFTHQNDPRSTNSSIFPFVDILSGGQYFTSFGYEPFSYGNLRDVTTYSYIDNITWNTGRNNIILGAQLDQSLTKNGFTPLGTSYYRFASWDDFKNGAKPLDFAQTFSLSPNFEQAFPTFKFKQFSMYLQDEISITNKFKLTLGVRADQTSYPNVTEIKTNPLLLGLTFAGGQKINTGNLPAPKTLISPRLGFNWDVVGDRSLQVRGGTGIFTGRIPFVWIVGQSGNSGMIQVTQSQNGPTNTPGPFNPNIGAYRPATVPAAGTVIPSSVTAFSENFKNPQVWKSSLAFDKKLGAGFVLTMEAIYNSDINTLYSKNINLVDPQAMNIPGYPDNRLIYPSSNAAKYINKLSPTGQPATTGTLNSLTAVVSGNAEKKGYYLSFTTKLEKQFGKGLFASVAYVYSASDNLYDGEGDQPVNTWNLIPHVNGANFENLAPSAYVVPSRVVAVISYRKEFLKHLGTTASLYYEGSSDGRFSYTYSGDLNRDGASGDLLYIPNSPSEINFVPLTIGSGSTAVIYSAQDQSNRFFAYIEQDKYLRNHKGQYAERNGALLPWRHRLDAKFIQDIFTNLGGKRNSLQFSIDILNFANLLNPDWGKIKIVNNSQLLTVTNVSSYSSGGAIKPLFTLANDRGLPVSQTFRDLVTVGSTYSMQFGLRYNFN
ncbi:carboxypeptidase regulatory-like domain-containing protein [soil metagenome]